MTDRELEDFLAENVMGWIGCFYGVWTTPNGCVACEKDRWHPLSDVSQAWRLIDKLSAYPESAVFVVCQPHDGNKASCMVFRGGARAFGPADIFLHLQDEDEFSKCDYDKESDYIKPAVKVAMKTAAQAICVAAAMVRGWKPTVESSV